jgi:competence protein ComEA
VWTTSACIAGAVAAAVSAAPQSLPDGRGRTEFEAVCARCHPIERSTMLRLSEGQWQAVVDDMIGRGAEASSDDFSLIVAYLARHFGPDAAVPTPKVNVNRATAAELAGALGLAAADAEAIVKHRESNGAYDAWPDLEKVPGIDLKKLEAVKDRIEFGERKGQAS